MAEDEIRNDIEMQAWFRDHIENAKKVLSRREVIKLTINFQGNKQVMEITRETFDSLTEDLLNHTIFLVNEMLDRNNISIDSVDEIILVGGSCYMPQVIRLLDNTYHKPILCNDPDTIVAQGAALLASRFKRNN